MQGSMPAACGNKKPRGVSGGVNLSFFIKEVTADSVIGYRYFIVVDLDLVVFVIIVLLASKSWVCSLCATEHSYTSLGQAYKSKTCANPPKAVGFSRL
jgi:hypothetical protein